MVKRAGRPKKSSDQLKGDFLKIRINPAEKAAFQKACDIAGIPLSAWARARLRRASIKELEDADIKIPFLPDGL